ncbi:MAG: cytochrome c oxidase subunit 3 [Chthoniobacterales bacterium]
MNNASYNNASIFHAPTAPEAVEHDHHAAPLTPPATCKLGMCIFLCSEALLFSGLITAYLVLRQAAGSWPPDFGDGIELPPMPKLLTGINTVILVSSSFVYHFAEVAVKKGKSGAGWMLLAALMGATFVGVQCIEWTELYHEGLWFNKGGVYGSTFFTLTGFHGAHVIIGVLLILWCFFLQVTKGTFTAKRHVALANVGLYWHFVDVVWVLLYTILYLV